MNKHDFIKLISDYQEFQEVWDKASEFVNVESDLFNYPINLFNFILWSNFNEEQIDWVEWWLYEHVNGCKVYDENEKEINLDSIEKLWNFIQDDTNKQRQ